MDHACLRPTPETIDMHHLLGPASLFAAVLATSVSAEVITVCASGCQHTSINAAIRDAEPGDVIQLAAEIYREGSVIDPTGKSITIRGVVDEDGDPASILDGGRTHRVLQCVSSESKATIFENLLIRGGRATNGAGMLNRTSSPTLIGCVLAENVGVGRGGGIYNRQASSPTLVRVRFVGNRASSGGGMYNFEGSSPSLVDCVFDRNVGPLVGGGMTNWTECSPTLTRCRFIRNRSDESPGGGGGAMYNIYRSNPLLTDCRFAGNVATNAGAIYTIGGTLIMTDCRFEDNAAGTCGGVQTLEAEVVATRCTFSKNSSQEPGAAFLTEDGSLVLTDCGFDGNVPTAIAMNIEATLQITNQTILNGDLDRDGDFDEADVRLAMAKFGLEAVTSEPDSVTDQDGP
ncbi:MAG: hypothetical protein CMJ51_07070 [Planctomycetaceae bacterium]|nr:hypothetical protein [Planctomycetaceae bacterium]